MVFTWLYWKELIDMKKTLLLLFLSISTIALSQESYYLNAPNAVNFSLNGIDLKDALSTKISNNVTFLPYSSSSFDTWDALMLSDINPLNSNEVLLIYGWEDGSDSDLRNDRERDINSNGGNTGDWNREHVFPKSLSGPALTTNNPGPGTDMHNLRPSDVQWNSTRGNLKFADGSGNSGTIGGNWYPGDEWKGDVARIIMYMYLSYDGDGSSIDETQCLPINVGIGSTVSNDSNMIDLFLQWNTDDPVSEVEKQRNPVSENNQGNRNPFIDNPYLATKIWGGSPAEDRWGTLGVNQLADHTFKVFPIPSNNHEIYIQSDIELIKTIALFNLIGEQVLTKHYPQNSSNKIILNNLPSGLYVLKINSENGIASKKIIIN